MAINKPFSVGIIRNPEIEISKRMEMEVIPHPDKTFHYKFTKGHDKLDCIFGEYRTHSFSSIRELGETIQNECLPNDVFVSGLAGYDKVPVLNPSQRQKMEIQGTLPKEFIQRTKANFNWPNTAGLLAVDIDEQKDGKYVSADEAIGYMEELFPKAPILVKGSTSSHVYYSGSKRVEDSEGNVIRPEGSVDRQDLTQKKGLRLYIVINSLSFLHKAKQYLGVKLWNLNTGYLSFDANGKDNFKCLIDLAMYSSTDRADFIKASLTKDIEGFEQDFGEFTYVNENEPPFDVRKLKDLTREEIAGYEAKKKAEQEKPENIELKKKIQEAKISVMMKNAEEKAKSPLTDIEKAKVRKSFKRLIESRELDELHPLFIMDKGSLKVITTLDIFKNEESVKYYHGKSCASVLDPYYTPGKEYKGQSGKSVNSIIESQGRGIDFTKAKILSLNEPPSIMDQAHGGTRFFFDTEFFDIKRLELERKDRSPTILPTWNFTEISNCFINQWNKDNINDVDNFGNVLLNLYKDDSSVGICYDDLIELCYNVFHSTLNKSSTHSKKVWSNLTGYGPSLYEFMNNGKKVGVSLKDSVILNKVNSIDVSMRYDIVNRGFYKAKGNRLDSIIAEKIHNKDFGWVYKLGTPGSLSDFQKEDVYYAEKGDDTVTKPVINMWLNSRYKERYSGGMEFLPVKGLVATKNSRMESSGKYIFNLYTGLNIVPKPMMKTHIEYKQDVNHYDLIEHSEQDGMDRKIVAWERQVKGWHLIDQHIMNVLCVGDKEKYEYMLNWIANMFQHPYRSGETLLAFQGEEGIGKNQFWDMVIRAFGSFATILTDPSSLTGNFNSGVAEKILVVLNEAFWEGDKKGHSILKGFVTDEFVMSKKKHVDDILVKNTSHLVIMTNHEAVAPMGIGDRRIVTFDVSNRYARNREYFGKLIEEMKNGGAEAFVYEMLNRDISEFNISKIPNSVHSESAIASVMNTAEPWLRWFYECMLDDEIHGLEVTGVLMQGNHTNVFSEYCDEHNGNVPVKELYESYLKWYETGVSGRNKLTNNMFTRNMKRVLYKHNKKNNPTLEDSEINRICYKKVNFKRENKMGKSDWSSVNCLVLNDLDFARESLISYINKVIVWEDIDEINEEG